MKLQNTSRRALVVESLESRAMLTTIFVQSGGSGDGSANSPFGAIQDAIDEAAARPGDDQIMIASGVYEENLEIEEADPVTLKGQGNVTIKHPALAPNEDPEDVIDAKSNVTLQNLNVVGANLGTTDEGRGIDVRADSVTLRNVNISGTDRDALRIRDAAFVSITNGSFTSLTDDGIQVENSGDVRLANVIAMWNGNEGLEAENVESIVVAGGNFSHNGDEGIDIDGASDIRLVNITASDNGGSGLQITPAGSAIANVTVTGSRFERNVANGVEIVEGADTIQNVELTGNHANDNTLKGFDIQVSGNLKAKGNTASGNADNTLP